MDLSTSGYFGPIVFGSTYLDQSTRSRSLHIVSHGYQDPRVLLRYGSPGKVLKQYEEFSKWYLKAFTPGTLKVLIGILDNYRNGQYVAPRVLQQTINYLNKW